MTWRKFLGESNLYTASKGQTGCLQQQIWTWQLNFVKKHFKKKGKNLQKHAFGSNACIALTGEFLFTD